MVFYHLDENGESCICGKELKYEKNFRHQSRYDENDYYSIEIIDIFTCPACDAVTVIRYVALGDGYSDAFSSKDPHYDLSRDYRRTVLHAPIKRLHEAIPQSISRVIYEAQSVLPKSTRASFILCRAALEEVCNEFEIPSERENSKGKTNFIPLGGRLTLLFEKEKLPDDLKAIVEGVKDLGNEGAHSDHLTFLKQVKEEEAERLLMLVNYIVERLYVDKFRHKEAEYELNELKEKILKSGE